ncbi:MAG: hypothetical protein IK062_00300 [Selenomonadaceae bacterium]|nr:hypothetical protein [Selenomonadaceae bacterium]
MTKATAEAIKAEVIKVYIANTYIFRGGSLHHSDKEFKTAIAAYKYLHKKMINYAGTTDATQTIEEYDGKTSTEIYENSTNGTEEKTTNAEIQTLIDKWNAEIDARITAKETNALMIAYLGEYAVSVDAQEVAIDAEIENAEKSEEVEEVDTADNTEEVEEIEAQATVDIENPKENIGTKFETKLDEGTFTTSLIVSKDNKKIIELYYIDGTRAFHKNFG